MRRVSNTRSGRPEQTVTQSVAGNPASGMSRRTMMKTVGLGTAALAVPGLAAGCSSSSGGATKIVFEETKPEVVPYFNNLVAKFNASQSHVVVSHDFTSSLIAEFVRGNPPAIDCDNYNLTTSIFVARGVLADLASLPQAKTIDPNIQALVTQYASYHGETSILPYSVAAEGVIYNMDLFDKVGVSSVPTTWSEFLAVAEKFKSAGITPIYQTYGDTWTTQQGLFDYTTGGMVDVAAFYQQMAREGTNLGPNSAVSYEKDFTAPCQKMLSMSPYFNDNPIAKHYADGNEAFANGQAGMYMQGPWAVGEVLAINPKLKMGTFALPATDDASQTKCRVIMFQLAFNVLLFSAFIRSIPVELEESARLDGCSTLQTFRKVVLPLLTPMAATVGIFAFLQSWNDFMMPQLITANPKWQTLPVIQYLFQDQFTTNFNVAFASYLMALLPTLVAFLIAQRWVVSGIMRGSIK